MNVFKWIFERFQYDLSLFLLQLGLDKFILLGHSLGGYLCAAYSLLCRFFKDKNGKNGSILLTLQMRHILESLDSVASEADGILKEA